MYDFASTVDKFVSSYKQPDQCSFAHDMCNKIVSYLMTSLYADTNSFVPIRVQSQSSGGAASSSALKAANFMDMVKTLKNSGADFHNAQTPSLSASGIAPTTLPSRVSLGSAKTTSTNGSKK